MLEVLIGALAELEEEAQTIVEAEGREIGVFRLGDEVYAYENRCPHQGGPACEGKIIPKVETIVRDDRTVAGERFSDTRIHFVCPWHGWEFDMRTGRHAGDPSYRVKPVDVVHRDGQIFLRLG